MAFLGLAVAVAMLYGDVLLALAIDWFNDPNYSHGWLVPPFALWLVYRRRAELRALEIRPSTGGLLLVAASLGLLLLGHAAFELFATRLSLIGVIAGSTAFLFGWRQLRIVGFPLLLVALAIPLPSLILNQVAFPLQLWASRLGVALLDVANVPAVREGNVIVLQQALLEVAEACSGVRSLVSLGTLALAYGALTEHAWRPRLAVLIAVLPIVIIVNGLRVAATGAVVHAYGLSVAAEVAHAAAGWIFFGLAVALLFAAERAAIRWLPPSALPARSL
jgi:exosortase